MRPTGSRRPRTRCGSDPRSREPTRSRPRSRSTARARSGRCGRPCPRRSRSSGRGARKPSGADGATGRSVRLRPPSRRRERRFDGGERGLRLRAVGTAGLRHVAAAAAALAAELLGAGAHEADGVDRRRQVVGDADDDAGLAVAGDADDRDDARAEALLALVGEALEVAHLDAREGARHELHAADVADRIAAAGAAHRELAPRLGELALEPALVLDQGRQALRRLLDRRLEEAGDRMQLAALGREVAARPIAGHRLEPAHARGDGALRDDGDDTDVAGAACMGAAAELDREGPVGALAAGCPAHRDDADLVAVFLAEEGAGPRVDRFLDAHQLRHHRLVLEEHGVGDVGDAPYLLVADWLWMAEVEAQAVRRDERALLGNMVAENLAQGLVQKMGRGVVGANAGAAGVVDGKFEGMADLEGALLDDDVVHEEVAELLLGVGDAHAHVDRRHGAGVPDLTAGFAVERRLVEDDEAALAGRELPHLFARLDDREHHALGDLGVVAEELSRADTLLEGEPEL